MTDAEHAERLKTLVASLNKAASEARYDGLSVDFDYTSEMFFVHKPYGEHYVKTVTLTVSRAL